MPPCEGPESRLRLGCGLSEGRPRWWELLLGLGAYSCAYSWAAWGQVT